jgi:hypothetical protein
MRLTMPLLAALLLCVARVDAQTNPCTVPAADIQNPTTIAIQAPDLSLSTVGGVSVSAITRANNTVLTTVTLTKTAFVLAPGTTDCWTTPIAITPLFQKNGTLYEVTARLTGASGAPDSPPSTKSNGFSFTIPPPAAPTVVRVTR